jgi:hypothetical protein
VKRPSYEEADKNSGAIPVANVVTELEAVDATEVPAEFVAVIVNV